MGAIDVRDLARAAAAGEQHGWDGLVERFGELVWSTTRAYGLSPGEGADAAQTTWLRLAEQLGRLEDQHERIGVWLAATARRESLRLLGAARGAIAASAPPWPATEPPAGAVPPAAAGPAQRAAAQPRGGLGRAGPAGRRHRRGAGRLPPGFSSPDVGFQYQGGRRRLLSKSA
jgi:DNA-directed RNA polymerase specialized sigma24 family protein